ncbi:MAG: amino acid ABC transporter permease [Chloroflexi bacterium]|nr:MAG: hypothetical protein B6I35_11755 [Anaerolineaceae bacterium 4572_32.2]RLC77508.1 MAG: amino acid ABC transporter permease [Chloroflexota bacterium]RLC79588.1 MAG: amino acid ABC transporter permease [Chloroflexota bacterium]HEY71699.1 amino acid ABC transporter permease [Thermoflexia bacterium]
MATKRTIEKSQPKLIPWIGNLSQAPWWAIIILLLGVLIVYFIVTAPAYQDAFLFLIAGLELTVSVTIISFSLALILGLIAGLGRVSKNVVFYTIATLYVEVIRGIPMLILIIYFAYVVTPLILTLLHWVGDTTLQSVTSGFLAQWAASLADINIQDVDLKIRAIVGLAFGYGAYEAEVFRAGIESITRGQMEAARSLGMSYFKAMRYVILPQAVRRVLPPLGNDFISMLKDSSLISILAVRDLTHLGKLNRARTFRTFETWNTVAFLYLCMTLLLSIGVRTLERRMSSDK